MQSMRKNQGGFAHDELLVVIAFWGVIIAIALPLLQAVVKAIQRGIDNGFSAWEIFGMVVIVLWPVYVIVGGLVLLNFVIEHWFTRKVSQEELDAVREKIDQQLQHLEEERKEIESSPVMDSNIHCPHCGKAIPENRSNDNPCWRLCFRCNGIFPTPFYRSECFDPDVPLPFAIVRSDEMLELNYPSEGFLAKCSQGWFAFWIAVIYLVSIGWIGSWVGVFIWSALWGHAVSDLIGCFMVFSILAGLLFFGTPLSSLFWRRETIRFDSKGVSLFAWGIALPYHYSFIPRRNLITLRLETYDRNECETSYNLYLDFHVADRNFGGESHLLYNTVTDKNVATKVAWEITAFLKSLPAFEGSKPTGGILDKQLRGDTPFFAVYCPACRNRHIVEVNDFNCCWKRHHFQCSFCSHSVEFEKALFEEGTLPPEPKPEPGRFRNGIAQPNTNDGIVVQTKSCVEMLGFWAAPYLCGLLAIGLFLSFGFFALMVHTAIRSGDCRPIYCSLHLAAIGVVFFFSWAVPYFVRREFSRWKTVLQADSIEYSYGVWQRTTRRLKRLSNLTVRRRNRAYTQPTDEPLNPAGAVAHAVILLNDDQIWAEIPCRDEQEVDWLYKELSERLLAFAGQSEEDCGGDRIIVN